MEQMDLIDWLDGKRVIRQQPPTQSTQHRLFIIEQLKPIMRELEALELSALTISEALAHYQNLYQEKAQQAILRAFE
ncbi:hypothetical protein [methanotrophic endosymbiont of Bathymodiolus puteoserpentis (Logatchev)]|uniref:hypothetical protein n=1 Tax=methanotrophic endosymbiont of Bathymodiolus puteoserpentis (Logatchev) TaxID=343235 RepID=UPI0013C79989|nr:hypothetical protein [methanotrophic endosymbiont of Bathymodiolus puteoserpentis (Logatchev)]SHE22518.1 hypothetical protein BPUTEOMOX_1987 [methanotrophic endosymbiont of Bathymodiolus puteoserpentis (Logatchev)]